MAAHSSIVEVQLVPGNFDSKSGGDEIDVTMAQVMIAVFLVAPPFHVGDGVALEKQTGALFKGRFKIVITTDSGRIYWGLGLRRLITDASGTRCHGTAFEKISPVVHATNRELTGSLIEA